MIIDGKQVPNATELSCDVCIVGAGAAGITCALEFLGTDTDVVVLESGGLAIDGDTQALAGGEVVGVDYVPLQASRLRFLGGTTNHWGGWTRPLEPIDFEARDWVPNSGWPITHQDLDPFYPAAQQLCEVAPAGNRVDDWALQPDAALAIGDRVETRITQYSPPTRFGPKYQPQLEAAENIRVLLNSNVLQLRNKQQGAIQHADVACLSGTNFSVKAKIFVVAAGGMENARLLLLSDDDNPNGLGNEHDNVGRYFMNHYFFSSGAVLLYGSQQPMDLYTQRNPHATAANPDGDDYRISGVLTISPQMQRRHGITNTSVNLVPIEAGNYFLSDNDGDEGWLDTLGNMFSNFDEIVGHAANKIRSKFDPPAANRMFEFLNICEQSPNRDSRIRLGDRLDALGQPITVLDWQLSELDRQSVARSHDLLAAAFTESGLGRVFSEMNVDDSEWPRDAGGDWHHMGTTRMSNMAEDGVVDANCKLHSVENVYVAGSSVFTTSGFSNPTLTLVALSVRLARHIKGLSNG